MHIPHRVFVSCFGLACRVLLGLISISSITFASDLDVTGHITATETISAVGAIDSDANSQSFGTQSTSTPTVPGSIFTYTDDSIPTGSIDSFKSLVNRTSASWLWLNGPGGGPFVNTMRLDDAHQLLLFKSDGTTAGLTFTPETYTIKLGTHANATLTGNTSTGLITAGGGLTVTGPLTVSGGITNNTGSFSGEPKFDNIPYTPTTTLSPTIGSASFAWGGVYVGTLTGNLTISSFSGTEAAGKRVRFVLVCSGSQSLTFPASYRAGQTNSTTTTFTPAAGRHVLLFESLDGAGLLLLTDTVYGQVDAASVAVAATPVHYSAASADVEAHLAGIDAALASAGTASVSDTAYNATSWDGVTTVAPSKNAVRDQLEAISTAASAPSQIATFWATADLTNKPAGWLNAGDGGTPAAATVGGYSMIVKSNGDVVAPTFSPAAGTYSSTQSVTLATSTSGASIRYTTNGTTPDRSTGTVYSTPISVAATETLKAIAYKDYWADSTVQSSAYTISGGSPVTFVQSAFGGGSFGGSSCTATFSANVTAGDAIAVAIQWNASSSLNISSVTDSLGNAYTLSASSKSQTSATHYAAIGTQIAYATNIAGGANTVTVTFSAGANGSCSVIEVSAAHLDQAAAGAGSSGAVNPGTASTTVNGSFGIAIGSIDDGTGIGSIFGSGTGWNLFYNAGGGASDFGSQYKAQATAGSLASAFANPIGSSQPWVASLLVFKP